MTDPVSQLERSWPLEQRRLVQALPRWREHQPLLCRFDSPAQLLRFLHASPPERTDGPLLALLALARSDRRAGRLVLQAILPALKTQAARVVAERAPREEVWELLLFFAWEAICAYPLARRRHVAANLVLQVLHDATRELQPPRQEPAALERVSETAGALPIDRARGEALLAVAVTAGAICDRDAELILRTRVDGISLRLLARSERVGYHGLRQRRQRAERRLRELLQGGGVSTAAVSDLTSGAAGLRRAA